jgi:hypothetical protein
VSIFLDFHIVSCLFEQQLQHVSDPWIVIDDEYSFRHAALLLLAEWDQTLAPAQTER